MTGIGVTLDHLQNCGWASVLSRASGSDCHDFSTAFSDAAAATSDEDQAGALLLLADVTSMMLRDEPEHARQPFDCWINMGGRRSALPEDFDADALRALAEFAREVDNAELRARLADLAWVRLRAFQSAKVALDAYLLAASELEAAENWPSMIARLVRQIRLAEMLGPSNQAYLDAGVRHIDQVLGALDVSSTAAFRIGHDLMSVLLDYRLGDPATYASLASKMAEQFKLEPDWMGARTFWNLAKRWYGLAGQDEDAQTAAIRAAGTFESAARDALNQSPPNRLVAVSHLANAVQAMRQLGQATDADRLHELLLRQQSLSMTQMGRVTSEGFDISDYISKARASVIGKPLKEALLTFVGLGPFPTKEYVRNAVDAIAKQAPLTQLIPHIGVNEYGRTVGVRPSRMSQDQAERERAIHLDMVEWVSKMQEAFTHATIDPAREQICLEHHLQPDYFLFLLDQNPLVEAGREYLIARGLYAGVIGDFPVAIHLLIPQFEHAIRYIFWQRGLIASSLTSAGVQDENNLNSLLYRTELAGIFPAGLILEWQTLFTESWGANLRNRMAHGLLHENGCYSAPARYACWLLLHFFCMPLLQQDGSVT